MGLLGLSRSGPGYLQSLLEKDFTSTFSGDKVAILGRIRGFAGRAELSSLVSSSREGGWVEEFVGEGSWDGMIDGFW